MAVPLVSYVYNTLYVTRYVPATCGCFKLGATYLTFNTMEEFRQWKTKEEESTYTTYVRHQQSHQHKDSKGKLQTCIQWNHLIMTTHVHVHMLHTYTHTYTHHTPTHIRMHAYTEGK